MEDKSDEKPNTAKLLRMKRYEQPPPGYFEDFLHEFRRRQRAELLQRPAWELLWDRVQSAAPAFRVPKLAYAAIVALALSASVFIMSDKPAGSAALAAGNTAHAASALSLTMSKPVIMRDTLPAAAHAGAALSSHYVLQPRPVSNEQPLSF